MGEHGIVVKVLEPYVSVIIKRTEACAKCGICTGISEKEMTVKAKNICGAKVGDTVEIELKDGVFIKSALIAYGIPFAFFIAGIIAGFLFSRLLGLERYEEIAAFFVGILFLAVSFPILKLLDNKIKNGQFEPFAVRVITPNKPL